MSKSNAYTYHQQTWRLSSSSHDTTTTSKPPYPQRRGGAPTGEGEVGALVMLGEREGLQRRRRRMGWLPGGGRGGEWGPVKVLMGLLGMGFWVQGFRCFPWMAVTFYLKDGLGVSPSTLQLMQNSANIPMVGKPFYGIISDAVYIGNGHRLPYIAIGAMLQAIAWLSIAILANSSISLLSLCTFLFLANLGASIVEVANDAMVAEAGKQPQISVNLQSFVWIFASSAGALGNLLGGVAINRIASRTMFLLFGLLLTIQFFVTISVPEQSLNLPPKTGPASKRASVRKQLIELFAALRNPEISYSIGWFAASYAIIPILMGTMFYYQTQHLNLNSSVIGLSKVFGQACVLAWSLAYDKWLQDVPPRKLLSSLQGTIVVLMVSDAFFVAGGYRQLGVPDSLYVIVFSGLMEALFQIKCLPFSVLMAQLCPPGCEGSLMAFVMSMIALSGIVSGYLGVALAAYVGMSANDFSGLTSAVIVQAACAAVPLYRSSWISDAGMSEFTQFKIK